MFDQETTAYKLAQSFMRLSKAEWHQRMTTGKKRSEMMLLFCIKRQAHDGEPAMRVSEISSLLRVASPTVTQTLNGLENKGLIERVMDKQDRRAVRVKLTEAGIKLTEEGEQRFADHMNGLIAYLGEEDSGQLVELLKKVYEYYDMLNQEHEQHK
ncbi:MarR family transcriptional regulator [Paenibacillus sp. ACRRX]|uniref:MarR family winged helix-turn-helix transcriptional regulator n=1 Tax=unclassified Paenibacillus TaxID=185978 RepID=UPI001EF55BB7|nr:MULTISPECIES: winged helix DNA-binding protein [unclassified Paenibacillus]MCG7408179.1 MarR family transcriptional regulator [Paenibacillus sp. ACRRX]MDK8181438.1 MarR family transcriptional regulator [Paenibacillus sp. UMB4589-SE434]